MSSSWISRGQKLTFLGGATLRTSTFSFVRASPHRLRARESPHPSLRNASASSRTRGLCWIRTRRISRSRRSREPVRMSQGIDRSRVAWREVPETLHFDLPRRGAQPRSRSMTAPFWPRAPVSARTPLPPACFDADQRELPGAISWLDGTRRATKSRHKSAPETFNRHRRDLDLRRIPRPRGPPMLRVSSWRGSGAFPHLDGDAPRGVVFFPFGRPPGRTPTTRSLTGRLRSGAPALEHMILKGPAASKTSDPGTPGRGRGPVAPRHRRNSCIRARPAGRRSAWRRWRSPVPVRRPRRGWTWQGSVLQRGLADAGIRNTRSRADTAGLRAVALIGSASMILTSGSPGEESCPLRGSRHDADRNAPSIDG